MRSADTAYTLQWQPAVTGLTVLDLGVGSGTMATISWCLNSSAMQCSAGYLLCSRRRQCRGRHHISDQPAWLCCAIPLAALPGLGGGSAETGTTPQSRVPGSAMQCSAGANFRCKRRPCRGRHHVSVQAAWCSLGQHTISQKTGAATHSLLMKHLPHWQPPVILTSASGSMGPRTLTPSISNCKPNGQWSAVCLTDPAEWAQSAACSLPSLCANCVPFMPAAIWSPACHGLQNSSMQATVLPSGGVLSKPAAHAGSTKRAKPTHRDHK